jgi:hypothetical protein
MKLKKAQGKNISNKKYSAQKDVKNMAKSTGINTSS